MGNKIPIYAERLYILRKSKNLTQEQISKELGCDIKSYRSWERGEKPPSTVFLLGLSSLLGVSIDYILGNTNYTHIGNKEISEITGLNQNSIDILRAIKLQPGGELYPMVLSCIVASSHFIELISQIRYYAGRVEQVKGRWNLHDKNAIAADTYTLRSEKFGVIDVFSDVLDELVPVQDKEGK